MNVSFNKEDQKVVIDILKAVGSKDKMKSLAAMTSLAQLVGPVVDQVLDQAATSSLVFQKKSYSLGEVPSIPMDLFFDNIEGTFMVWSQSIAGGLPSNMVWGADEYRFTTWTLASAVHWLKAYAEKSRPDLDVVSRAITRLAQEVLIKQEYQLWSILLGALAQARANGAAQLVDAVEAGRFQVADVNNLWTRIQRLRKSWVGGTPTAQVGRGLTDLFVSPEVMGDIRSMAYNPVNTIAGPTSTVGTEVGSTVGIPLPDAMRQQIFQNSGMNEIFGVRIHVLQELGVGQSYNDLFDDLYTASGGDPDFTKVSDELVIGIDLSVPSAIKVEAVDGEYDSVFRVEPDDQWVSRSKKVGFWGECEMGAIVVDSKAYYGVVV